MLHTAFVTTEWFGHIETQIKKKKKKKKNSTYFTENVFPRLLNCISGEHQSPEWYIQAPNVGKIILASIVFYLWVNV
jgi:hypothetical protein